MTWRTVVIASNSKLELRMNYLVVRDAEIRKVHLSEISVLIIESTAVSMTSMLLCELCRRGIKVIFCDEAHNPYGTLEPLFGSHDSVGKLRSQVQWKMETKAEVWRMIVREKILNQANLLELHDYECAMMLRDYADSVAPGDTTNREGHAAKVYFNSLFGNGFSRKDDCPINAHLNYGYSILLSAVNREITATGHTTEIGLFHDNVFNHFNLGSDLMEPLRPLVDTIVLSLPEDEVTTESKRTLARMLEDEVSIQDRTQRLANALGIYVRSVMDAMDADEPNRIVFCSI